MPYGELLTSCCGLWKLTGRSCRNTFNSVVRAQYPIVFSTLCRSYSVAEPRWFISLIKSLRCELRRSLMNRGEINIVHFWHWLSDRKINISTSHILSCVGRCPAKYFYIIFLSFPSPLPFFPLPLPDTKPILMKIFLPVRWWVICFMSLFQCVI